MRDGCRRRQRETAAAFRESSENVIDGAKEAGAEARLLIVVPSGSVLEIGFGKRSNDEPAPHPIYGL
jgi:hypothetical protein